MASKPDMNKVADSRPKSAIPTAITPNQKQVKASGRGQTNGGVIPTDPALGEQVLGEQMLGEQVLGEKEQQLTRLANSLVLPADGIIELPADGIVDLTAEDSDEDIVPSKDKEYVPERRVNATLSRTEKVVTRSASKAKVAEASPKVSSGRFVFIIKKNKDGKTILTKKPSPGKKQLSPQRAVLNSSGENRRLKIRIKDAKLSPTQGQKKTTAGSSQSQSPCRSGRLRSGKMLREGSVLSKMSVEENKIVQQFRNVLDKFSDEEMKIWEQLSAICDRYRCNPSDLVK